MGQKAKRREFDKYQDQEVEVVPLEVSNYHISRLINSSLVLTIVSQLSSHELNKAYPAKYFLYNLLIISAFLESSDSK